MSWLKNMGIAFKTGRGLPASRADLYEYCEGHDQEASRSCRMEGSFRFDHVQRQRCASHHRRLLPRTIIQTSSRQDRCRSNSLPCSVLSASTKLCRISCGETCI